MQNETKFLYWMKWTDRSNRRQKSVYGIAYKVMIQILKLPSFRQWYLS